MTHTRIVVYQKYRLRLSLVVKGIPRNSRKFMHCKI